MRAPGLALLWPQLTAKERAGFHRAYRDKYGKNVRLASVLGILAFVSFAFVDPFLVSGDTLYHVWAARAVIVMVIGGLCLASTHVHLREYSSECLCSSFPAVSKISLASNVALD